MMDKFDKLLEKKGKKLRPLEQKAKSDVLSHLQDEASAGLGDKLSGIKKVSVAAPSKEGLAEGLDKAKELLGQMPENGEMKEEAPSIEEIDAKIQMLLELKKQLEAEENSSSDAGTENY